MRKSKFKIIPLKKILDKEIYILSLIDQDYKLTTKIYYTIEDAQKAMQEQYFAALKLYGITSEEAEKFCSLKNVYAQVSNEIVCFTWTISKQEVEF